MKKNTLSIIGLVIQCFGLGFMGYNLNNNRLWIGLAVTFFGLALVFVGILLDNAKNK